MAFVAKSGDHAIVEIVFGLALSRSWHASEINKLAQNHYRWKEDLPRLSRHEIRQVVIGEGPSQVIASPSGLGISFERIKPNGNLAWRLLCEDKTILVNCLEYTRWKDTWAVAYRYMRDALCIIDTDDMSIAGASLQYIDVFDWTSDPNEYDVFQLLDVESEYVPKSVGMYGSVWHLHQGWFDPINNPVSGRILKKAHFDAISTSESGQPTVKLDTLLRADFSNYISARTFFQESSDLEKMFIYMHNSNKKLVSSFLTKAICKNIGLEDEQ